MNGARSQRKSQFSLRDSKQNGQGSGRGAGRLVTPFQWPYSLIFGFPNPILFVVDVVVVSSNPGTCPSWVTPWQPRARGYPFSP